MRFVHGHWLFMALPQSIVPLIQTCSAFASVYLDKLLFCPLSLWANQSWFIIHQADTVPNLLQQNGGAVVAEEEGMRRIVTWTRPLLQFPCELMLGDNGIHFLRAARFACVCVCMRIRRGCCNELWQQPALVLKARIHFSPCLLHL